MSDAWQVPEFWKKHQNRCGSYYPFGLAMQGISSKALSFGNPDNKFKFNSIVQNNDFDLNMYDAFYRNLDPQTGRFWQIDPKPNEMTSSYSAMMNNPIRFSDPLGDTTWVYNQNGVLCGVVNDKLKNEVHYIKTEGDPGQPFDASGLSKKEAKALGKAFRDASFAFIGSKTVADMKSIVSKSVDAKVEIAFVGVIGKDKEIRLNALPIDQGKDGDGGNQLSQVPSGRQIDDNYTATQQQSTVLEGHTHIAAYLDGMKSTITMRSFIQNGLPDQSPSKGVGGDLRDYGPALDRGNGKGAAPSMVITPFGVTLYGTGAAHMSPMFQPSPNNTYLNYQSLK